MNKTAHEIARDKALAKSRKENIIKREKIRAVFRANPEALSLLNELFYHTAAERGRVESNDRVRVMIGHNEVLETLNRIEAMEDETIPVNE